MLTPEFLRTKFDAALPYDDYVATGDPRQREDWSAAADRVSLTAPQRTLLAGFTRPMPVLVSSGVWCGDCVVQVPMLRAVEAANPRVISLRVLDRDEHADLAERVQICGGLRVPTVIFMNEVFDFVSITGDRTLARYRAIAARKLGAACPLPGAPVPADEIAATLQDWVDEFERVQLLLLLSPKLRQLHGE